MNLLQVVTPTNVIDWGNLIRLGASGILSVSALVVVWKSAVFFGRVSVAFDAMKTELPLLRDVIRHVTESLAMFISLTQTTHTDFEERLDQLEAPPSRRRG